MSRIFYSGLLFLMVAIGFGQTEGPVPTTDEISPEQGQSDIAGIQLAFRSGNDPIRIPPRPPAVAGVRG